MNKLELIKKMIEEDVQKAVNELMSYVLLLEDEGIVSCDNPIWGKYVEYGNFTEAVIINEYDFDLLDNHWYEDLNMGNRDGFIVKEITKESVLNIIAEFENLLKIA
jgi:hypothetical protein